MFQVVAIRTKLAWKKNKKQQMEDNWLRQRKNEDSEKTSAVRLV